MLDRKTLLGLAVAGLFVAGPAGRAFAAATPVVPLPAMTTTASVAGDEDDEKGPKKREKEHEKEHDEKDEEHEEKHGKHEKHEEKEIEQAVPMNMVPQAVLDAVMKECPGGKVTESELEAKKGKIVYAFDVKVGDVTYDVKISVDGKFISKKVDDDGDNEKDEKKPAAPAEKK